MSVLEKNVFSGPNGLSDYLNPTCHPLLPLVEVPRQLNEFYDDGVRLFVKLPPMLSMKQFGAHGMWQQREKEPGFSELEEVWLNSSGNMAVAVAIEGMVRYGKGTTHAIVPDDIAPGKFEFMRLTGVKARLQNTLPEGESSGSYVRRMGSKKYSWYAAQYELPSNPAGYRRLAEEIWTQTEGLLQFVGFALGTSGMGNGLHDALSSQVKYVAGYASSEDQIPGARSQGRLKDVPLYRPSRFDHLIEVTTHTAYVWSFRLCRFGLLVGPSTGLAYAATLKVLKKLKQEGSLNVCRNANGEVVVIVMGHDTPFLYLDKYSTQLNKRDYAWQPR